jgi:hypothetical protein
MKGTCDMTSHEFDAYCDSQDRAEQEDSILLIEQERDFDEIEAEKEKNLKRQGAIEALHNLTLTLSLLILRDDVKGDYFFGLHDALQVAKSKLALMKGGVL